MKSQSPLLGFNNNVRHKGRVFHIQTEDSGVRHPHVITHLFADGGRILKTTKTSYVDHVDETTLVETVRAMMKEQHKAMFIALRDGQLDHLLADLPPAQADKAKLAAEAAARAVVPAEVIAAAPLELPPLVMEPEVAVPDDAAHANTEPPPSQATPAVVHMPAPPISPRVRTLDPRVETAEEAAAAAAAAEAPSSEKRKTSRPRLQLDPGALHRSNSPLAPTLEMVPVTNDASIDLDLDALERAAAEAGTGSVLSRGNDLPPPPASMLGKKTGARPGTGYSVTSPTTNTGQGSTPSQGTPRIGNAPVPPGAGRYAPSRPAAIFAAARPQDGASIFGEDLISEKSLDEVILSYLAEDLDAPGEKK